MARFLCAAAIACVLGIEIPTLGLVSPVNPEAPAKASRRTLTFRERVAYQRVIEEVYWRHRIWLKDNPQPKPPLDAVISREQLEKKVEDYLRKSQLVAHQRGRPITASELQTEMDRMAQHTKQPDVLRELFEALGTDPFVIAECLARPILAERLAAGPSVLAGVSPALTGFSAADTAASTDNRLRAQTNPGHAGYKLAEISVATGCTDDTWSATSVVNAPDARDGHTAIWTGGEMIVWGGYDGNSDVNTGGRYDPATDSWTPTSTTNAPIGRWLHTAVWTGSEMIVWGGGYGTDFLNTGGRYNPTTDTWTPTNTTNAPTARVHHTAVWTGSQMIVWGGYNYTNGRFNTGGRYDPSTDSWTATSTINAPEARWDHNAEWAGSEMVVWGGTNETIYLNTGAKYNPTDDTWTPTSTANAPLGRVGHTAIWSGSEMMVWGGTDSTFNDTNTGGRYNPTADSWTATSAVNAPSPRDSLAAVWIGSEMIVWGGVFCCPGVEFNTGGRYNAGTDSWTPTSTANAPFPRYSLQQLNFAVWTGSEMIVWGGYNHTYNLFFNTGGRYCAQPPPTPTPTPTATGSPTPTATATATVTVTATPTPTSTPRPTPTPRTEPTPRGRPTPPPRP
jgi:N-acetylneuraminic acid mutarotase